MQLLTILFEEKNKYLSYEGKEIPILEAYILFYQVFTHTLTLSLSQSITPSLTHTLTHSHTHSLTLSHTHSQPPSLTRTHTPSLTLYLTHFLTDNVKLFMKRFGRPLRFCHLELNKEDICDGCRNKNCPLSGGGGGNFK